jgi:hypothetical protein
MRHGTPHFPEGSKARYQLTVAKGFVGMLGRNVEPRAWAERVPAVILLLCGGFKVPTLCTVVSSLQEKAVNLSEWPRGTSILPKKSLEVFLSSKL